MKAGVAISPQCPSCGARMAFANGQTDEMFNTLQFDALMCVTPYCPHYNVKFDRLYVELEAYSGSYIRRKLREKRRAAQRVRVR